MTQLVDDHRQERALQHVAGRPRVKRERHDQRAGNGGRTQLPLVVSVVIHLEIVHDIESYHGMIVV